MTETARHEITTSADKVLPKSGVEGILLYFLLYLNIGISFELWG